MTTTDHYRPVAAEPSLALVDRAFYGFTATPCRPSVPFHDQTNQRIRNRVHDRLRYGPPTVLVAETVAQAPAATALAAAQACREGIQGFTGDMEATDDQATPRERVADDPRSQAVWARLAARIPCRLGRITLGELPSTSRKPPRAPMARAFRSMSIRLYWNPRFRRREDQDRPRRCSSSNDFNGVAESRARVFYSRRPLTITSTRQGRGWWRRISRPG
ncbi:MAG: hypothetical protein WKF75_04300 [Singulisphaera sp.]